MNGYLLENGIGQWVMVLIDCVLRRDLKKMIRQFNRIIIYRMLFVCVFVRVSICIYLSANLSVCRSDVCNYHENHKNCEKCICHKQTDRVRFDYDGRYLLVVINEND